MTELKVYSLKEIAAHNTRKDIWMVIDGKVYDVTKFLDEHPGGEEVLLEQAGVDASDAFEEIGHSDDARELLKKMLVGEVDPEELKAQAASAPAAAAAVPKAEAKASSGGSSFAFVLVPVVAVVAFLIYQYLEQQKK